MEHYWCLRWLLQEGVDETTGDGDPRQAGPLRAAAARRAARRTCRRSPPDTRVRIAVGRIDLLAATLECRYAGGAADDRRMQLATSAIRMPAA